jgi:aspartyl-tRNA(Asn)/glutamyl-tRNA(Gln) amidotransferase subunit B
MKAFEPVIGLEVHAELSTRSKMFCGCAVVDSTSAEPNSAVCEICTGLPGTLPVLNARAVEYALRTALALNCRVAETSLFARKNYFYPDLPKGYQISQYEMPLASDGWLDIPAARGDKRIGIRRVHLEEDTGKLFHREGYSLVDYNRSGVPLLEIVTEPDLGSVEEVKAYAIELRSLLRYLEVTSGDMEKGAIRFDANVSVRPAGTSGLGVRTEVKNLNSFRALVRALEFEIDRQIDLVSHGQPVLQETLGWDERLGQTTSQRGKEEAHDYRYFPEPDLPPLHIDPAQLEAIRASLPELPGAKRARFAAQHGLSEYATRVLTAEREVADYFEGAAAAAPELPPARIAHWLSGELFGLLNQAGITIQQAKVSPAALAELVRLVEAGEINAASGKVVLEEVFATGRAPRQVVRDRGLFQLSDRTEIERLVAEVLQSHPDQVDGYLRGKTAIAHWFFGQVMRAAGGRADPALVRQSLETALEALAREARRP